MSRPILELLVRLGQQRLDLLGTPAQDAREQRRVVGLDALELHGLVEGADLLHLGVFGPGSDWELE